MDDNTKIRALMVYFRHWGKSEAQACKTVHGMNKTMMLLREEFLKDATMTKLEDELKRMHNYMFDNEDTYYLWLELADILLQDCGGCFETIMMDGLYDEEEMLLDRKMVLENNLGNECDILYDYDFGYKDVLSVDAIVALPVIHPKNDYDT